MANQRRLADNTNHYEAGHTGAPRRGAALLQGIAICGRCGRRMNLRYTGPNGDYPVYCCRADKNQRGGALCQEVRALAVDELVEGALLEALAPDRIAIAIAAVGELEEESRQLERQWTLRRERARYEAERARRQYDAVEPENRLVARSLERAWEEKLRVVEVIEQEHARSRPGDPLVISDTDRAGLQALGENLPRIWHASTTSAAETDASGANVAATISRFNASGHERLRRRRVAVMPITDLWTLLTLTSPRIKSERVNLGSSTRRPPPEGYA
jgi:hypothetical protein